MSERLRLTKTRYRSTSELGSIATEIGCPCHDRFPPESDRTEDIAACLKCANKRHRLTSPDHLECCKRGRSAATQGIGSLRYLFEEYTFDTSLRELHRGVDVVSVTPQVFDLLDYLIRNRERVVSKDDLINAVCNGRIVSDAALTTRPNAPRS